MVGCLNFCFRNFTIQQSYWTKSQFNKSFFNNVQLNNRISQQKGNLTIPFWTGAAQQICLNNWTNSLNSGLCNNFLKPLMTLTRYPSLNYPSHNWSQPWILEDVIISSNPWWLSHPIQAAIWSKPWILKDVIIFSNPWRLSPLTEPRLSKPQLIQTKNSEGCNNFLKPLMTFTPCSKN